jgi:outer membrane protein
MPQNHKMKRIGILSALLAFVAAAVAQNSGAFAPVPPPSHPQSPAGALMASPPQVQTAPAAAVTNAAAGRTMSLADCLQAALAHNFDVQIQRINPQISLYDLNAAYSGYDPTFNFSGTHSYDNSGGSFQNGQRVAGSETKEDSFSSGISGVLPLGTIYSLQGNVSSTKGNQFGTISNIFIKSPLQSSSGQIGAMTLTQPLLKNFWIDSTRLNIRVAKNRLKFSEQGLREQLITSVTAVANAYYELIFAQENVQVQQEALQLSQTQLDQDQQRLQIGTLALLSVQQDQSQVAQNQANLIAAQSTLDTDQNILKNLLTDDYSRSHAMDIQPSEALTAQMELFDLQDSWNKGMTERPDLLQAKLNVEQQGIQLKYDKNQLFPELDLTGTYGYNGSGQQFDDTFDQFGQANQPFYSYGATLSIPLGNVGPRNQYKATKATLQQVLLQLKQLEQTVMVEIDNAVKTAQSNYQSVEATKQARIYAEEALDAEQKTYAVGKATTFEVLQYQNSLTTARSQEIRALANYNEALANLAAQEGVSLEHYNVNLEVK